MGKVLDTITPTLADFIAAQHVFFVATAPGAEGHVNLSPRGLDTFAVLGPSSVAWLDLTGSGIETIAHLKADRRITVMFCAFDGPPNIVRLYGHGEVLPLESPVARPIRDRFPDYPGARAVIRVDVDRVSTSCGYAVPRLRYEGDRDTLIEWAQRKGADGIAQYHADKNARSIDGLPGIP